jgi:thioredoxin reductase (NADPH)
MSINAQVSLDSSAPAVVSDLHQIAVGTGHAAIAATRIHKILPAHFR